jgi:DNA-binding transcriptional LysR family regulator
MITQRRLLHLITLVEHAHFGRAAKALNISQPALTKSIQALETELAVTLVDRKSGSISLTVFGELVVQRSAVWLTAEEDLRREIKLLVEHEIGSLKVALGPYPSVTSGYQGVARLLAKHPKTQVTVHVVGWREVAQQVLARTVDLGIAEISELQGNQQFITELLGQHQARVLCRPGHPILKLDQVSLAQLTKFPWICSRIPSRFTAALPKNLGAAGVIDPENGDFVPAIEIDVPMQLAGFLTGSDVLVFALLTSVERELQAGEAVIVPVTGLELKSAYGFIYLNNRSLAPATLAYMQKVRAVEAEITTREAALASKFGVQ